MESTEKQSSSENKEVIELKINKESFNRFEYINFKNKLIASQIDFDANNNSKFLLVKLPMIQIFYVEFINKKIKFYIKSRDVVLIDCSNSTLNITLERINKVVDNRDIWSKFIRVKDCYLIRKGDVKGYDYNRQEVLISSSTHQIQKTRLKIGRIFKEILFENIKDVAQNFLLIKSVDLVEYVIYPQNIRCIISRNKFKQIFLENNEFCSSIEVKLSKSSELLHGFFEDEWKILLNDGMFIRLNRATILNLFFFDKKHLLNNLYNDSVCGEIKVDKKALLELNS
jgi:hypothetical protein